MTEIPAPVDTDVDNQDSKEVLILKRLMKGEVVDGLTVAQQKFLAMRPRFRNNLDAANYVNIKVGSVTVWKYKSSFFKELLEAAEEYYIASPSAVDTAGVLLKDNVVAAAHKQIELVSKPLQWKNPAILAQQRIASKDMLVSYGLLKADGGKGSDNVVKLHVLVEQTFGKDKPPKVIDVEPTDYTVNQLQQEQSAQLPSSDQT